MQIIKEKYPNKKVIGTTATEIRYLDNEKNMNDILFDGVCASELSLSDSILQGLLPAPKYITTNKEMLNDLSNTERIIDRYCYTKNQKIEAKKLVEKYKEYASKLLNKEDELKEFQDINNGKFIIFSSQIDNIKKDEQKIKSIFNKSDINIYEVNSSNSKEKK